MINKKNILVITGSPRKNGNSDLLAGAFIKGAEKSGHSIVRFDAGRKKISGCIACNKCYSKGTACVFKDDFNELAPLVEKADMLVLVSPVYWFSFSAQIKAALDKFYALIVGKRTINIKENVLLACAETDDMTDFDGIVRSYELVNRYMEWSDRGRLLVPNVNNIGDILKTNTLEEAEKIGLNV